MAFAYHTQNLFVPGTFGESGPVVTWFHQWGWTFVDLFFVISGYIFAHVYLDGKLRARDGMSTFAVARFARLYPLHLVTLLVCAALFFDEPRNTIGTFFAHLTMVHGMLGTAGRGFNNPSWSISVEIVCYILFAAAAAASRKTLLLVTWSAVGISLFYFAAMAQPGGPWIGDGLFRGLLGFFIGQLLWHGRAGLSHLPAMVLAGALCIGLVADTGSFSSLLPLALVAWPAALLLSLRTRFMESAPLLWLGDRSYAIYLVHEPVIKAVNKFHGPFAGPDWAVWLLHGLFVAAVLVLSDLAYRFIERPSRSAIRAAWAQRQPERAARSA